MPSTSWQLVRTAGLCTCGRHYNPEEAAQDLRKRELHMLQHRKMQGTQTNKLRKKAQLTQAFLFTARRLQPAY
ncbi:UNVERIFIED_CONTAM: hypothetical protein FKN15_004881 [Acipenser sinensis]